MEIDHYFQMILSARVKRKVATFADRAISSQPVPKILVWITVVVSVQSNVMLKVLKATYRDGELILQEKLGSEWEGKAIDIFIEVQNTEDTKDKGAEVQAFLEKWQQQPAKLVEGYQFDRERFQL